MVQHARREAASNGTHETSLAKCILFGDSCLADARRARTQFRARAFLEADRCAARTAAKATCKTKPGLSHAIRSRSADLGSSARGERPRSRPLLHEEGGLGCCDRPLSRRHRGQTWVCHSLPLSRRSAREKGCEETSH